MARCHLCLRAPETEPAPLLSTLTHGRAWPRSIPFTSYARTIGRLETDAATTPLCDRCRCRLGAGESRLLRRALRPALFGWEVRPTIRYGSWLPRFVASIAWRVLDVQAAGLDAEVAPLGADLREASATWRAYAAGERANVGRFLLYLLPIVPLVDEWRQAAYAQRAGAMQALVARTGDAFVWMKVPGAVALGAVRAPILSGRPLDERAGIWDSRAAVVPGLLRFLMFEELQRSLSRSHGPQAAYPAAI